MKRRILLAVLGGWTVSAATPEQTLRGKIRQDAGKPPAIETADRKIYTVGGDEFTRGQMADPKLKGREIELEGRFEPPGHFYASKIYTIKAGKRYIVTYWCDICSIRTHMPGQCMCCQGDTDLQEMPVR